MSTPIAPVASRPSATPSSTTPEPNASAQRLQEQHDLEALAVDGGEAEQREAEHHAPRRVAVRSELSSERRRRWWWAIQPVQ